MNGNYSHKINYIRAYIHYLKGAHVEIRLPQSDRELHMLNHCYYYAKNTLHKQGKTLHV